MEDERLRAECQQCGWAASATDHRRLDQMCDVHERYFPDHQVLEV